MGFIHLLNIPGAPSGTGTNSILMDIVTEYDSKDLESQMASFHNPRLCLNKVTYIFNLQGDTRAPSLPRCIYDNEFGPTRHSRFDFTTIN